MFRVYNFLSGPQNVGLGFDSEPGPIFLSGRGSPLSDPTQSFIRTTHQSSREIVSKFYPYSAKSFKKISQIFIRHGIRDLPVLSGVLRQSYGNKFLMKIPYLVDFPAIV